MLGIILGFVVGAGIATGLIILGVAMLKGKAINIHINRTEKSIQTPTEKIIPVSDPEAEEKINAYIKKQREDKIGMDSVVETVNKVMGIEIIEQEEK